MSCNIKDNQRTTFDHLVNCDIPKLLKESSHLVNNRYLIQFNEFPFSKEPIKRDGTIFSTVKTQCVIEDKVTGETVNFTIDLLNLPLYQELGFCIKGNYMQMLDSYDRTAGWTFSKGQKLGKNIIKASLLPAGEYAKSLNFIYDGKNILVSRRSKKQADEDTDITKVDIATFFQAVSDYSREELIQIFGIDNPYVIAAFTNSSNLKELKRYNTNNRNDCIEATSYAFNGAKISKNMTNLIDKQRFLRRSLFNKRYLYLGNGNAKRLLHAESFKHRAINKTLAEDIVVKGEVISAGTTLTEMLLNNIDNSPIDQLKVVYNNKTYTLKKFSHFTFRALGCILAESITFDGKKLPKGKVLTQDDLDFLNASSLEKIDVLLDKRSQFKVCLKRRLKADELHLDDILTAVSILFDNINGFDTYDSEYELTNRVVVPWDKKVCNIIESHLRMITNSLESSLERLQDDMYLMDAISDFNTDKIEDRNTKFDVDRFISLISDKDVKTGQMADMNNILSYLEKDNKVTADISSKSVTDDLVRVQDTQAGRLDPIDAPESSKIGIVHYKTVLTKVDEDGYLLVPYLPVHNGEVVSDEPIYLTAVEEGGKYIAEWNETFKNEDGSPKKRILARHDGNVVTIDRDAVTLKEYSQLTTMSPARSCIPFQNHSNSKRLLMSCNHQKQAVPPLKTQRPFVNTGCESMLGIGVYKASMILDNFYDSIYAYYPDIKEHEIEIKSSDIKLVSIEEEPNYRTLYFNILAVKNLNIDSNMKIKDEISLKVPYNQKNPDKGLFSYRINVKSDGVYHCDEVVAYNTGYNLEKHKKVEYVDYGALPHDSKDFDTGLSLGTNLTVAFKTYESSTIDDAITISSNLVYDDTLTSIYMVDVEEELHNSSNKVQRFGILNNSKCPDYLMSNGLPKIGTILKPGDPVISIVEQKNGAPVSKIKYLDSYLEGQVVYADIRIKNKQRCAKVILASRSNIETGDKLSGRYGNKGVIAKIKPAEEMPYDPETGEAIDIILNPLGIPSRMNISQLLELVVGEAMKLSGQIAIISPFYNNDFSLVKDIANNYNIHPRMLCDGRTGRMFERPINVGVMYMYKLVHMAKKKIHSIGMDVPVDPVFFQPRRGQKNEGGQSFGEMELWCLAGIGANKVLQDIYSLQSDDHMAMYSFNNALDEDPKETNVTGENNNHIAIQVFLRSMCIELESDEISNSYEFVPLTDKKIRSLSIMPVDDSKALHAPSIFGSANRSKEKILTRNQWGWIDLNTEIICPIWFYKGDLNKLILKYGTGNSVTSVSKNDLLDIVESKKYVFYKPDEELGILLLANNLDGIDEKNKKNWHTGMNAVVNIFRNYDTDKTLSYYEEKIIPKILSKEDSELKDQDLNTLKIYNMIKNFCENGNLLEDYIISSYPVMPTNFRPKLENAAINSVADFDWHYTQIFNAIKQLNNSGETPVTQLAIFNAIKRFIGIGTDNSNKKADKYQNLHLWFTGKGSTNHNHGKIREALQKKRTVCSGRSVIIPMSDVKMSPLHMGIPYTMVTNIYGDLIIAYLRSLIESKDEYKVSMSSWRKLISYISSGNTGKFYKLYNKQFSSLFGIETSQAFNRIDEYIRSFVEGWGDNEPLVVIAGRQPSLHQFSIRAFYIKIVTGKAIQIHPLSCKGYNADFDGDTMWLMALLTSEARKEAMEKMSPQFNFINPKNGNIILEHSQDIVLGCYCATMLENNAESIDEIFDSPEDFLNSIHYYDSVIALESDVKSGIIHAYDFVCLNYFSNKYISTAGRILFNSLFADGFTDDTFTNPLSLPLENANSFYNLKYDGIITSGSGNGNIKYYHIPDICLDLYLNEGPNCIYTYQDMLEFGFFFSDRFSVSLSIEDLDIDNNKKQLIKSADDLKEKIEKDFQNGLISPEDKKNAIIKLYKNTNDSIKSDLVSSMPRNNNLFIIFDSGARGNAGQIMQTCGAIGILQKTKTEDLETSITSNYTEGISSFDMHLTTYSGRTGVASTQNETSEAGHDTRQAVYESAGLNIVEHDCHKENWWYDVIWGEHKPEFDRLIPTREWFENNIVGLVPADDSTKAIFVGHLDNGFIDEDGYSCLLDGFHEMTFFNDNNDKITFITSYDSEGITNDENTLVLTPLNKELVNDDESLLEFKYLLSNSNRINNKCISLAKSKHLLHINTNIGRFEFRYALDKLSSSLLLNREARNLPYLKQVVTKYSPKDVEYENGIHEASINVITQKTLDYISENGLSRIEARILLDCNSKNGICAHCYGLKFTNLKLPKINENVGIESAQAIGEPAAQLTMSLFHKGGSAGESVANGVAIINSMLNGSIPKRSRKAQIAQRSGYARIDRLDDTVSIKLEPNFGLDKKAKKKDIPDEYLIGNKIQAAALMISDGQYVRAGEQITDGFIMPNSIVDVESHLPDELLRKKQMVWLQLYFDTFTSNNIFIFPRHFEIFTRLQNFTVIITKSQNPKFEIGKTYQYSEILGENDISFQFRISKQEDVIRDNSGPLSLLSFEDVSNKVCNFVVSGIKSDVKHNATIGCISIGSNVVTKELKTFKRLTSDKTIDKSVHILDEFDSGKEEVVVISKSLDSLGNNNTINTLMDSFNFDDVLDDSSDNSASSTDASDINLSSLELFNDSSSDKKESNMDEEYFDDQDSFDFNLDFGSDVDSNDIDIDTIDYSDDTDNDVSDGDTRDNPSLDTLSLF